MRKTHPVLRCALAVMLACGLMIPTVALTAFADVENSLTPPLAVTDVAAAPDDGADAAAAAAASKARAANAGGFTVEGGTQATGPTPGTGDWFFDTTKGTLLILSSTPLTVSTSGQTTNNIEVYPGVKADLTLAGVNINSPLAPINLVTNSREDKSGVKATNGDQIVNKTMLYLTIAENTTNTLVCSDAGTTGSPGIRCGWGSVLVIDDAITNVRQGGSKFNLDDIVTPENGMVPYDVTLIDGKTTLSKGDPLLGMDAEGCVLNVIGGGHSAGIGSGPNENAGTLVFNGGDITARCLPFGTNYAISNGAGIGGGSNGSGTVMIFNGGTVDAYGGSCGAGIGSGLGYHTKDHLAGVTKGDAIDIPTGAGAEARSGGYSFKAAPQDVDWFCCKTSYMTCPGRVHFLISATAENYFTVAGDITVNGGLINVTSGAHGNALGQSCAHGPSSNRNHVIRVTGGTVKTTVKGADPGGFTPGPDRPPVASLGAAFGYTIVTGGSIQLATDEGTGKPAFQGIGDTAFNTQGIATWDDVEAYKTAHDGNGLPDNDKVFMLTVNLKDSDEKLTNEKITKFDLYIGGNKQNYGLPAQFTEGKLYLWLPEWAADPKAPQEVRIEMAVLKGGVSTPIDPLFITKPDANNPDQTAKRWIEFTFPADYQKYLTKDYDGLPFDPLKVGPDNVIEVNREQGGVPIKETLKNGADVTFKYQMLKQDEEGEWVPDGLESAEGATSLPADAGRFSVTMISYEYAKLDNYKASYWGHQAKGTAVINRVPAVLEIEGVEWGHLDVDKPEGASDAWTPIVADQEAGGVAGNRLKLTFNVRSANTTALTCAAPTGEFQVRIDGVDVGDPIKLTADAVTASKHSTFEQKDIEVKSKTGGTETRHATVVTYYLDPANRDGLLELLEQAGDGGEHKVSIEYIADRNYVQGVDKNPDNASEDDAFIVPVPPKGDVGSDDPDKVQVEDTPTVPGGSDPSDPSDPDKPVDPDNPTGKTQVIRKTVTVNYRDFHQEGVALDDFFPLELTSTSSVKPTYAVSNAAVATLMPAVEGTPAYGPGGSPALDDKGRLKVQVNSCGTSVITVEQKPNALYTGLKYILTVNVKPDPTIKPQVQIRMTWRNLTAIREASPAPAVATFARVLAAADAANAGVGMSSRMARAVADRTHTPPRPGDVLEYTVTGLNLTPGSAWQAAELRDAIDKKLTFDEDEVELAPNYATHSDQTQLGSDAFYAGFNWDGLDWAPVSRGTGDGDYQFDDASATLSKAIGTVYGGQSTSVRFQAVVGEDEGLGDRPAGGKLPEIVNKPEGTGDYGKPEGTLKPGEPVPDPKPLDPGTDIVYVGDDDPVPGKPATPDPIPVLPKDPAEPDIVTTVDVAQKGHVEEHDDDRILVGDTLGVTVTSKNQGADSCLTNAVVKVTLPQGFEPKEGTIKLKDGAGNTYDVPMSAYDPKTGIIAVNAGDLYGGEDAVLTFDVEVTSVYDPDDPSDPNDPDGPGNPGNPGDPSDPGNPGGPDDPDAPGPERPTSPVIEGGTLGETPTDEWEREHPTDPDAEPADPDDKPKPGTPFEPGRPWEDLEEEFVTPDPVKPVMPPVLPASPKLEDDKDGKADVTVAKDAQNLSSADGTTHVGDVVRYTITVTNAKANTIWYDVVIRDDVPMGLEPLKDSIKLTSRDGAAHDVPDGAYDVETRRLAVTAGDLRGPGAVTLVFDALVTEEAAGADIGNVAEAFGTLPSGVDAGAVGEGVSRPTGGEPFEPEDGWKQFERDHAGLANPDASYPAGVDAKGGVIAEPRPEDPAGDGTGTKAPIRLAQTGDELVAPSVALVMAAAAAGVMLMAAAAQHRRRREALVSRHRSQW